MPDFPDLSDTFARVQRMTSLQPLRVRPQADEITEASTAGEVVSRLQGVIGEFMATLNSDEEVGAAVASFGVQHIIRVTGFRAVGPNVLVIQGDESGRAVELIQHISQLNFLLVRIPVASPETAPIRKIGFHTD